jgi:hypothetical protein
MTGLILLRYQLLPQKITTKVNETNKKISEFKEEIIPKPTEILKDGLPDRHLINAPFVEQAPFKDWSQPWQDSCEEAALLTIYYYYRNINPTKDQIKNDILSMIDFEAKMGWPIDINVEKMSEIAENYLHLKTEILDNPSIEDIKTAVSKNHPVLIPASGKILFKENSHFHSGGPYYHNIVVVGFDESKQQFIVNDVGTQYGKNFRYSYNLLIDSIHDFPNTGQKEDIQLGAKKALVLLQ